MIRQDIDLDLGRFSGDDIPIDWYVTTGPAVEVDAAVADGATSMTVKPLKRAIANAAKIRFATRGEAGITVTLSSDAKVGATTLSIAAISGYLYQGQLGAQVQDITGFTLEMTVVLPPSATALLTKTVTIQDADEGQMRATLTDDDTGTTLTSKSYFYRVRRTDANLEATLVYGDLTLRRV